VEAWTSILIPVALQKAFTGQRRASQAIFPGMVPSGRHTAAGRRRTTSESSRRPEDLPEIFSVKWPCNVRRWLLRRLWWSTSIEILVSHGKRLTGQPRASQAKRERRFTVHNDTDTQRTLTQRTHTAVCCFSVKWPSDARRWPLRPVASTTGISILVSHQTALTGQRRASHGHIPGMVSSRSGWTAEKTLADTLYEGLPEMFSVKWPSDARRWLLRPVSLRPSISILVPHGTRLSGQRRASQAILRTCPHCRVRAGAGWQERGLDSGWLRVL
jgi:hypothetical protein